MLEVIHPGIAPVLALTPPKSLPVGSNYNGALLRPITVNFVVQAGVGAVSVMEKEESLQISRRLIHCNVQVVPPVCPTQCLGTTLKEFL